MQFRCFNEAGVIEFREFLGRLRDDPFVELRSGLLTEVETSTPLEPETVAEPVRFGSRFDFARWLHLAFVSAGSGSPKNDVGFWSWLTAALFDQVCPADGNGRRNPGADARYIPDSTRWTRRYRHLLANPYYIYELHRDAPESAYAALANPIDKPGELTEQLTSRLDIVSCRGTMAVATRLFVDQYSHKPKRGASGNAARRFAKLMNQYTRTWDLHSVRSEQFIKILPREFDRFR